MPDLSKRPERYATAVVAALMAGSVAYTSLGIHIGGDSELAQARARNKELERQLEQVRPTPTVTKTVQPQVSGAVLRRNCSYFPNQEAAQAFWTLHNGFGSKPFMLAEYGTVERPGKPSGKSDWFAGIPNALKQLPHLRALVYFNLPAPPANCDWLITTSRSARTGFGTLAGSEPFQWTAGQNPERRD
jgi:hypothetical protein